MDNSILYEDSARTESDGESMMQNLESKLKEWFEWFHAHPELAYEEYRTTEKIREILEKAGIEILPYDLQTGLVARVCGEGDGPVRALRCDMDALPIQEETALSYASKEAGKMHACGHDFHIVAGIGCALLLQEKKNEWKGSVKIIFQPAEETSLGALTILETDVMQDADCIWGFHADPRNDVGSIGVREGYVTAAVDRFRIIVTGRGCHGAHPDDGTDPVVAAAAIIQALQTIVTRNINAFHPALISVTKVQAGNTWNVIPDKAELEGTVRTLERSDRVLVEKRLKEIAEYTALAYGVKAQVEWVSGPPSTRNDIKMVEKSIETAKKYGLTLVEQRSSMGGDDFAFYEGKIPGCYIKIGTGKGEPIHKPGFTINPQVLYPAAEYLTALLMD